MSDTLSLDDFNIGFNLKFGYATVTISHQNGTIFGTQRVESNEVYKSAFRKLASRDYCHYALVRSLGYSTRPNTRSRPPYFTPQARWSDYCRQLIRRGRKAVGLPASYDVAAIATVIRDLKIAAEKMLGFEITAAAASVPRIPAIYDENLYNSFEYVGLESLQITEATYHETFLTYESMAALAGHGLAVCPNITDPNTCPIETLQDNYIVIDYTKESLFAYSTHARSAYYVIKSAAFDLDLGSDAQHNYPYEEHYWYAVRQILLRPFLENINNPIKNIILGGEESSINNTGFREILNDVIEEFFLDKPVPEIIARDPEWVQAKGVAELVRRRPYLPIPVRPEMKVGSQRDFRNEIEKKQDIILGDQLEL